MNFRDLFDEEQLENVKRGLISQPDLVNQRDFLSCHCCRSSYC